MAANSANSHPAGNLPGGCLPAGSAAPTLGQIMRRPRWIAALLAVLAVAGFFAFLAQWQLSHAIRLDGEQVIDTETPAELYDLAQPGEPVTDAAAGHLVEVSGVLQRQDLVIVANRLNGGETGYWVAGRAEVLGPDGSIDNLTVAFGWSANVTGAKAAIAKLQSASQSTSYEMPTLAGRYNPTESPEPAQEIEGVPVYATLAPSQQVNLWSSSSGSEISERTFSGYLVLAAESDILSDSGLSPIDSVAPSQPEKINWLNLFYALEWVIFAGFAVYFWVRLCKDAQEKEHELLALKHAGSAVGEN